MLDTTPMRDPKTDALLTPENAVLALIDYQPSNMRAWPPWGTTSCSRTSACMGALPRHSSCLSS